MRMSTLSLRAAIVTAASSLTLCAATVAPAQVSIVIGERAMPAPIVETVLPAPGPGFAWVPGHWVWRGGNWFWVKGHYFRGVVPPMPAAIVEAVPARPRPEAVWVKGHWGWEGNRWTWHAGVWF
jgi:hypothetical protein